jgi:hypothetical protein
MYETNLKLRRTYSFERDWASGKREAYGGPPVCALDKPLGKRV